VKGMILEMAQKLLEIEDLQQVFSVVKWLAEN